MRQTLLPYLAAHRLVALVACTVLVLSGPCASAQEAELPNNPLEDPDRWLAQERWSELRYGLSVREPHDVERIPDTAQGDVMRWALPNGIRIRLSFARGVYEGVDAQGKTVRLPAKIDILKKQIGDEMKLAMAGNVFNTRADQVIEVGELVGVMNYFVVKPDAAGAKDMLFGVALLQLDDMSVAVLRLECPPQQIVEAVSTFECMAHSIKVEPAKDVNRRLHGWLVNGEELLAKLDQQARLDAMRGDRLYRVLEEGRDLGFVRVWQRHQDEAYYKKLKQQAGDSPIGGIDRLGVTGNAVVVQSHFEGRGASIDRLYESVDDLNEVNEYWQFKTALRYKNDPSNRRAGSWAETGVRGVRVIGGKRTDHVQLTLEGTPPRHMVEFLLERENDPGRRLRYPSSVKGSYPSGDLKEKAWPTPKRAYLSVVDAMLMPAMLPREEKTYCFSAYHLESSKIDFRLMRVVPNADGGKTVYLRPLLDLSEQKLVFDRDNELVSRTFPDGRVLKRTTRQELAWIWGAKLRD